MEDLSHIIDEKITKKLRTLRRRASDRPNIVIRIIGFIVLAAAIAMKFMDLMDDWPSIILAVLGGILLTGERITDTLSSWKGKK